MLRLVTGNFATDFSDVLSALADLAWPALLLVALFLFRTEISGLIQRVRKASTPLGSLEIDRELDRAQVSTDRAAESIPEEPAQLPREPRGIDMAIPSRHDQEEGSGDTEAVLGPVSESRTHWPFEDPGAAILAEAARSPRAALMSLSALIERRSRSRRAYR